MSVPISYRKKCFKRSIADQDGATIYRHKHWQQIKEVKGMLSIINSLRSCCADIFALKALVSKIFVVIVK